MNVNSQNEVERMLLELDQMCDAFEQRGWYALAADAEQLYAGIHAKLGRTVQHSRQERLMREAASFTPKQGRP